MFRCFVEDRKYNAWYYEPQDDTLDSPLNYKMFNGDVFFKNDLNEIIVQQSPVKKCINIPGILLLENNRTYGRTDNKKRLYYKCKPNDPSLPYFLIPYEIPMGFNKNFKNKYITFHYQHWNEKHPHGIISQNLGDVYDLPAFNEYQLYCKGLHSSISQAITKTKKKVSEHEMDYYQNEIVMNPKRFGEISFSHNQDDIFVFSIDPRGCTDRDDALSIITSYTGEIVEHLVTVYIANVWIWLDIFDLWDTIGERVSTIYFPDMKRPMLPTMLGEQLCSLDQGQHRFAMCMDFTIIEHPRKGVYIQYLDSTRPTISQCSITVKRNFAYEEPLLLDNAHYQQLLRVTQKLDQNIHNSHELVAYWMMQMNYYTARHMKYEKFGLFRTVQSKKESFVESDVLPTFVRIWEQQMSGSYVPFENREQNLSHDVLGYSQYIHFTSPIRRLADLLNQISWVKNHMKVENMSKGVLNFYNTHMAKIDLLNDKMKKIRRIQADAHILYNVTHDPEILDKTYDAIVLTLAGEKSTVYIDELKWLTHGKVSDDANIYDLVQCKLFVFENEEKMSKKIRIQIV